MALYYCPECGKQISEHAVNCPGCGYPMGEFLKKKAEEAKKAAAVPDYSKPEDGGYNVFLAQEGESITATAQILADVCGYTFADAYSLASNLPTIVVYNATLTQAKAAANALADYGLDVSVYDKDGYVDFDDMKYDETKTTKTDNGIEIATELARELNTLTAANLIRSAYIRSYAYPHPLELLMPRRTRSIFSYSAPLFSPGYLERGLCGGPSYSAPTRPSGYTPWMSTPVSRPRSTKSYSSYTPWSIPSSAPRTPSYRPRTGSRSGSSNTWRPSGVGNSRVYSSKSSSSFGSRSSSSFGSRSMSGMSRSNGSRMGSSAGRMGGMSKGGGFKKK